MVTPEGSGLRYQKVKKDILDFCKLLNVAVPALKW
jgi:hypothetical protein